MKIVKSKSVVWNLYYVVGDSSKNDIMRTENFGEIFFEVPNNSFGIYDVYLQTYLKVFFNLLRPITELITDDYLPEHRWKKKTAADLRISGDFSKIEGDLTLSEVAQINFLHRTCQGPKNFIFIDFKKLFRSEQIRRIYDGILSVEKEQGAN